MPFGGMIAVIGATPDYDYVFSDDTMTLVGALIYAPTYGAALTVQATIGAAPNVLGGSIYAPPILSSWHTAGAVTSDIRTDVQFRLSYVSGTAYSTFGLALATWHNFTAGAYPAGSWGWTFLGTGAGNGVYTLEMRDAATLVVMDTATLTVLT